MAGETDELNLKLYLFLINLNLKKPTHKPIIGEFLGTSGTTWVWESSLSHCKFDETYMQIDPWCWDRLSGPLARSQHESNADSGNGASGAALSPSCTFLHSVLTAPQQVKSTLTSHLTGDRASHVTRLGRPGGRIHTQTLRLQSCSSPLHKLPFTVPFLSNHLCVFK